MSIRVTCSLPKSERHAILRQMRLVGATACALVAWATFALLILSFSDQGYRIQYVNSQEYLGVQVASGRLCVEWITDPSALQLLEDFDRVDTVDLAAFVTTPDLLSRSGGPWHMGHVLWGVSFQGEAADFLLRVPLVWIAVGFAGCVVALTLPSHLRRRRVRRRLARGECIDCGFDLRASARVCPECGMPVAGTSADCAHP